MGAPFVDLHVGTPVHSSTDGVLVGFAINQISHGALLDFPEVFNIDFGQVTSNPSNIWFSSLVLLFRTVVGGFSLALAIAIRDTLMVLWQSNKKVKAPKAKMSSTSTSTIDATSAHA